MSELKTLVYRYVDVIHRMGTSELKSRIGGKQRGNLHLAILDATGLTVFQFGGLPFYHEIKTVEDSAAQLYEALIKAKARKSRAISDEAGDDEGWRESD